MLTHLRLLHLADSALPIGSAAHSFGLETQVGEAFLSKAGLGTYLAACLEEALLLEAVYCRAAHTCSLTGEALEDLNHRLSAIRVAREARSASQALGRRFAKLLALLEPAEQGFQTLAALADLHFCIAFGYACGKLCITAEAAAESYLHQSIAAALSASQRLMRLGQAEASLIFWDLKPAILHAVERSGSLTPQSVFCFSHLPELASMRHPTLTTRLFIS